MELHKNLKFWASVKQNIFLDNDADFLTEIPSFEFQWEKNEGFVKKVKELAGEFLINYLFKNEFKVSESVFSKKFGWEWSLENQRKVMEDFVDYIIFKKQ